MLKKLIIGATLAAALSAPALAQSYNPSVGSGNLVPPITQAPAASPYAPGHAYGPTGLNALNPFAYFNAYAYEPAPAPRHGRVRHRD